MRRLLKWGAIGFTVLVVFGIIATALGGESKEPESTVAQGTVAQVSASKTPKAAATPTVDPAEAAYRLSITKHTATLGESMGHFGELTTQASNRPALLADNNWRIKVAIETATWQVTGAEIRKLSAPPRFQPAHQKIVAATNLLDQAAIDFTEGVDNLDAAKINQANVKITQVGLLMQEATALLP